MTAQPSRIVRDEPEPEPILETPAEAAAGLSGAPLRRAMTFVTVAWMFGAVWMHALGGAPLTVFATDLGASNFEFGLLAAMPFIAALLSLPASILTDRSGERKRIFLVALYLNRLLWIPIGVVPMWVVYKYGEAGTSLAIFLFLALTFLMHAGQAIGGPAWVSWMADVVPDRVRGRYFARRRQWGIVTAVPAALLAGWAVDYYQTQSFGGMGMLTACAMIFCMAAMFGVVDVAMFHFVPHQVKPKPRQPLLRTLLTPLRNSRFAWFSVCTGVLWFAIAGQGQFVNKYLYDHLQITSTRVQLIVLVCPLLTQLIVLPVWGKAIDRFGKKPSMLIAIIGLAPVGAGWCLMNGEHVWLGYVLAIAGAACWTGVEVANFNLVLELSGTDTRGQQGGSSYVAMNSLIVNVAGCLGGLFYGVLAQKLQHFQMDVNVLWMTSVSFYEIIFAVSAALRVLAVIALLMVHEPEARPTVDAFRFMAGNLYNNLVGAVLLPVRLVRREPVDVPAEG